MKENNSVKFKSKKTIFAAVAIAVLVSVSCTGCKKKDANAFPKSGAIAGWEKTSETRTFAAKDLWKYIDGDAEQQTEHQHDEGNSGRIDVEEALQTLKRREPVLLEGRDRGARPCQRLLKLMRSTRPCG